MHFCLASRTPICDQLCFKLVLQVVDRISGETFEFDALAHVLVS